MSDFALGVLSMDFEFARLPNRPGMCGRAFYLGKSVSIDVDWQGDLGHARLDLPITLPAVVTLEFGGKSDQDLVIVDNAIVHDTYVKICSVNLDGWQLNDVFLHQKIQMRTSDNQDIVSAYIGHCGYINLEFLKTNIMSQVIECNRTQSS